MRIGLLLSASLVLSACSADADEMAVNAMEAQSPAVETLVSAELAGMIERGEVVLIDVRSPQEFAESRIPGALNAPVETFDPAFIPLEDGRETILYCRSANRSGVAARLLADYTGTTVRHLDGGMIAWDAAGLDTITSPPRD